ncbi:uncharacterized protein RAG0_00224 [Rhynchosporium agropyri]|uniref:Uncharacterized protein n=1 Tax=Rhynchosporium agropyri TaxID=914238 RepID=A0A1E1JS46_9HELO|nr:uncharacterized protein RAG0_00224 [Rhynchosporium agropyri]
MTLITVYRYWFQYHCLNKCDRTITTRYQRSTPTKSPLAKDPNPPQHACTCIIPAAGFERPLSSSKEDPNNTGRWFFCCKCGNGWFEDRISDYEGPLQSCRRCYPNGMWSLEDCNRTKEFLEYHSSEDGKNSADESATSNSRVGPDSDRGEISDSDEDASIDQVPVISNWASEVLSRRKYFLSGLSVESPPIQQVTSSDISSSLLDIPVPTYRVGLLVPNFEQDDEDDDMEETRGISSDNTDASIIEEPQTFASMEHADEDVNAMMLDIEEFDLETLEEIETLFLETSSDITFESQLTNPGESIIEEEPQSSFSPFYEPVPPSDPPVTLTENGHRIQEIRDFFSIPATVPTRQIPSLFRNHQRVTASLGGGSILTRSGIIAGYPHVEVRSGNRDRMNEIYNLLLVIDWQEDLAQEVSYFSDSSSLSSDNIPAGKPNQVEEDWESPAAANLDIIHLDDGDEKLFCQAVEASQEESFNLVPETQQPRIHTDPASPHRVSDSSGLRTELAVRLKGAEGGGSEQ